MVNGRHTENPLARQFKRRDLDNDRHGLQYENSTHNKKYDFVASNDRHCSQCGTQCQRTDIAHKYLSRVRVKPQKTQSSTGDTAAEYRQFTTASDIGNVQVSSEIYAASEIGNDTQRSPYKHSRKYRQPIQSVGQVHRVARPDDHKIAQYNKEWPHAPDEILEEGNIQFCSDGRIKG